MLQDTWPATCAQVESWSVTQLLRWRQEPQSTEQSVQINFSLESPESKAEVILLNILRNSTWYEQKIRGEKTKKIAITKEK